MRDSKGRFRKGKDHPLFGKHLSPEYKLKVSEGLNGHVVTKETREKIGAANKNRTPSQAAREKMSIAQSGKKHWRWKEKIIVSCVVCEKTREILASRLRHGKGVCCSSKCCGIYSMQRTKKKDTKIELLIEKELLRREIPYKKQVALLGMTLVDFLLPSKIVIYCDGEYWHGKQSVKERDEAQNSALTANGYRVLRLTETQIKKSPADCVDKVIRTHDDLPWRKRL